MAGATVTLIPTGLQTTTGPDGIYRLSGLPTGTFAVRVTHPDLELLGGEPLEEEATLEAGRATRIMVAASLAELALDRCGEVGAFDDPVVIYGDVRQPRGETPAPGALVRLFTRVGEERVVSDGGGRYALCVERTDTVALAAVGPADAFVSGSELDLRNVAVESGVMTRVDLALDLESVASAADQGTAHRGERWSNALIGTVVRHDTGTPIPGAMVLVRDVDGRPVHSSITNEDGQFRFVHPDPITTEFELTVEHVGYGKITQVVTFRPAEQLDVEVVMTERPIDLAPIVVTQRRQGFLADMGYYRRLERGVGLFVQREEIERRVPSRVTDLLQGRSGLRVVRTGIGTYDVRVLAPSRLGGDCQPAIWVDGILVRPGGTPRISSVSGQPLQPQLSTIVSPEEVEAVEVYTGPAGLPLQYGGSEAACGAVLIWTRR